MIRIIHTFMEDYRCQLADFVNIHHQTDKSTSANGNENIFLFHPRNFCVEVIWSFLWLNVIHIIHYLIVNSASYDKFYFTNALWYYNPNWIKYEWLDDARKYYLTKICFGTKNYSKKKYSCTQVLMCAYWWKLPMYVNIN